jgi:hypothetical protein
MALAPWVGKRIKAAEAAAQVYLDSIPDTVHTAPGWRVLGDDFFTCVQPVGGPIHDPAVVAAIHGFDPGAIPMWRKQRYLPPRSTQAVLVSHLAFGRHVRFPRRQLALFNVEMPPGQRQHPVPNELLMIWEFFDATYWYEGGPGAVFPSDMRQFRYMRADYLKGDKKGGDRFAEREAQSLAARERARESSARENEHKQRHLDAYVARQLDMPGDTVRAFREYRARNRAMRAQAAARLGLSRGAH